jgi:hypothetical protein
MDLPLFFVAAYLVEEQQPLLLARLSCTCRGQVHTRLVKLYPLAQWSKSFLTQEKIHGFEI